MRNQQQRELLDRLHAAMLKNLVGDSRLEIIGLLTEIVTSGLDFESHPRIREKYAECLKGLEFHLTKRLIK